MTRRDVTRRDVSKWKKPIPDRFMTFFASTFSQRRHLLFLVALQCSESLTFKGWGCCCYISRRSRGWMGVGVCVSVRQSVKPFFLVHAFCVVHIFLTQNRIGFVSSMLMSYNVGNIMRMGTRVKDQISILKFV